MVPSSATDRPIPGLTMPGVELVATGIDTLPLTVESTNPVLSRISVSWAVKHVVAVTLFRGSSLSFKRIVYFGVVHDVHKVAHQLLGLHHKVAQFVQT